MEGSIQGDSRACTDATGAGDDVILGGPGLEAIIGDSFAVCEGGTASGAGGNDFIDPGPDGGSDAIGDHNSFGSAVGTGNDIIIGGSADDYLVGDSSPNVGERSHDGRQRRHLGGGGNDVIFGDHTIFGDETFGTVGGRMRSAAVTAWTRSRPGRATTASTAAPARPTTATAKQASIARERAN